jgi:hypothetical protein
LKLTECISEEDRTALLRRLNDIENLKISKIFGPNA